MRGGAQAPLGEFGGRGRGTLRGIIIVVFKKEEKWWGRQTSHEGEAHLGKRYDTSVAHEVLCARCMFKRKW